MENYDFSGWATRANVKCSDGRTIMKDAFKHNDGRTVPLVWNHQHNDPANVLGHATLENREEGVYAYCSFNETEAGQLAKVLVQHGDIHALSIYANQLKQQNGNVMHGEIREVSLVHAGANPSAYIESVMKHSDDGEYVEVEDEARIFTGEKIELYHAAKKAEEEKGPEGEKKSEEKEPEGEKKSEDSDKSEDDETIAEVYEAFTDKQKKVVHYLIGKAFEAGYEDEEVDEDDDDEEEVKHTDIEGGNPTMKTNVFDQKDEVVQNSVLSHADQETIIGMAKQSNVGSLRLAMNLYKEENENLAHGFETEALEALLPDHKNLTPGAPEILRPDQSWVMAVINKIHKSPYSRIRTRQADARIADLRAKGYQKKGDQKTLTNNIDLIGRTFDPQTIYIKDQVHRDDVIDITDFDYVAYIWNLMKSNMYETLALAALVGDGRDNADPDKIHEKHVCSIWNDDELYTHHVDIDIDDARAKIQGTNTNANFGDEYIFAEAIIMANLFARETFKGSGRPDWYVDPHTVNRMLLARDLNGRRIYDSKEDLAKALNVNAIHEVEQFAGKTRVAKDGTTKKLLGLIVNLSDYQFGSTKGGEITKFEDFDIDFNTHKYLLETRLSGALVKLDSAIALEMTVEEAAG